MTILEILVLAIALLVMIVGLLGIVIPNLPGVILVWTGVFFYGSLTQFELLDKDYILFITSLAMFAILVEYAETVWGRKKINHGIRGIIGAILGGIVGGVVGSNTMMIVGTIIGATFGIILSGRDPVITVEAKNYKVIIYIGSTIIQIAVGVAIIESFLVRVFS